VDRKLSEGEGLVFGALPGSLMRVEDGVFCDWPGWQFRGRIVVRLPGRKVVIPLG